MLKISFFPSKDPSSRYCPIFCRAVLTSEGYPTRSVHQFWSVVSNVGSLKAVTLIDESCQILREGSVVAFCCGMILCKVAGSNLNVGLTNCGPLFLIR